jgi:DNA-binding response OmpR family regulator
VIATAVMTDSPAKLPSARRVVLVEDDVDTRELIARSLRDAGYDVEEAGDGDDALAAIRREPPVLVITDCNLPHMSGNELLEVLALDDRLRLIPAIVISARKQATLPANVSVFLAKPFKMEQLRAAVRACLATAASGAS